MPTEEQTCDSTLQQIPTDGSKLILTLSLPTFSPQEVFAYWTEPDLLPHWWPAEQTEIEPHVGGKYHVSWLTRNYYLRATILAFEPGSRFAFTWVWLDDPTAPETQVEVNLMPQGGGTHLTLTQGPYSNTPDDQRRRVEEHLTGWLHFLAKLEALQADNDRQPPAPLDGEA